MKLFTGFKRLDSRGISHLLLPMVVVFALAVGGTYMLVASHADQASPSTALAAAKTQGQVTPKNSGVLVVYNNDSQNSYDRAKVTPQGHINVVVNKKSHETDTFGCAGVSKSGRTIVFGKKNSKALKCDATNNTGGYNISYTKGSAGDVSFTVDVDKGYCTVVYPNAALTYKTLPSKKGVCPEASKALSPKDVTLTVLVNKPTKGSVALSGYVNIKAPLAVNKNWCSGSVTLSISGLSGSHSYPIKYVGSGKSNNGHSYCVAKFTSIGRGQVVKGQSYSVTANFSGNPYLKAGSDTSPAVTMLNSVKK